MSMSKDDFLKFLRGDQFKRGEMPQTHEGYLDRMWSAYQWGIEAGKDEAIDRIAALLKQSISS